MNIRMCPIWPCQACINMLVAHVRGRWNLYGAAQWAHERRGILHGTVRYG